MIESATTCSRPGAHHRPPSPPRHEFLDAEISSAPLSSVPANALRYVSEQLGIADPAIIGGYGGDARASRHRDLIRRHDGFHETGSTPIGGSVPAGSLAGELGLDEGRAAGAAFELAAAWLREARVLLPGASTLERLVLLVRDRMESRLHRRLLAVAKPAEIDRLEDLLLGEAGEERALLETLRRGPQRVSCRGLVQATDRLAEVRRLGDESWDLRDLPSGRTARRAAEAMSSGILDLRRMPALQRRALLVAFVHAMRYQAQDDVLNILDPYLRMLLGRVLRKDRRERMRSLRGLDRAARDLAAACAALLDDGVSDVPVRGSAFARVPSPRAQRQ